MAALVDASDVDRHSISRGPAMHGKYARSPQRLRCHFSQVDFIRSVSGLQRFLRNRHRYAGFLPSAVWRSLFSAPSEPKGSTNLELQSNRGATTMMSNEGTVYGPEELSLLGQVLDQIMQSLPSNLRTPSNRVAIARNILTCAMSGERDPDALGRAAMTDPAASVAA